MLKRQRQQIRARSAMRVKYNWKNNERHERRHKQIACPHAESEKAREKQKYEKLKNQRKQQK